ncbi:alpha/beta fold hydrolase, partial [Dyadobacter sp.]|uniref:alpha/beta fold hydrolase n=1 Tax=Dyadobacter sp. TaxID=1914288 RepID=UPI003F72D94D
FNFKWLAASMIRTARRGTFSKSDIAAYKRAWRQPNALTSMINWYRAFAQSPPATINEAIEVPALILWGTKDLFLSKKMAEQSVARCTQGQLILIENASHWLHHEEPDLVNGYIFAFLNK